jgi:hypothetical protein
MDLTFDMTGDRKAQPFANEGPKPRVQPHWFSFDSVDQGMKSESTRVPPLLAENVIANLPANYSAMHSIVWLGFVVLGGWDETTKECRE